MAHAHPPTIPPNPSTPHPHPPTHPGDCFSTGVISDGNPYGVKEGLVFSFPCRSKGDGDYEICNDFILDDWLRCAGCSKSKYQFAVVLGGAFVGFAARNLSLRAASAGLYRRRRRVGRGRWSPPIAVRGSGAVSHGRTGRWKANGPQLRGSPHT
jgi:hypothetical protein